MRENCIRVENLSKSFSGKKVVDNLSFDVKRGEVFALLGHNGAGKSTTIDLILGLKVPDQGSARILGMEARTKRKKVFEEVGVQLQNTQYQNLITVEEVCMEYASMYPIAADYKELMNQFGLSHLKNSFVNKLSGGERQRLPVVLSLIGKPKIVFLDELTTGLDVVARHEVWSTLKQLKNQGLTIFLTTHYMEEAEALCNHVCLIDVMIFCLALPMVVFALITMITGEKIAGGLGLTYLQGAYVSLSTVGICCCAFMSIPLTIVDLRDKGILRRLYCSPCSPARLLICDILSSGILAVVSTVLLTVLAVIFGYRMQGSVLVYLLVWLLTMGSMFSMGLMVAGLCRSTKSLNITTSVLYFPMLLFSGATIPLEVFPKGVQAVAKWLPLGIGIDSLKKVSAGCYNELIIPILALIGITIICTTIAIKTFRWE